MAQNLCLMYSDSELDDFSNFLSLKKKNQYDFGFQYPSQKQKSMLHIN